MIDSVANQISTIKKDVAEIKPATSNLYRGWTFYFLGCYALQPLLF